MSLTEARSTLLSFLTNTYDSDSDNGVETLLDTEALYLAARTASIKLQDVKSVNNEFLQKVNEQIDESIDTFPLFKEALLAENRREIKKDKSQSNKE